VVCFPYGILRLNVRGCLIGSLWPLLAPPSWLFVPGPRLPIPLRYRWALTGVGTCEQDIVIAGERVWVEPAGAATAIVTFHGGTETFVLLMFGRLPQGMQATHYSVYAYAASASGRA
jgi:hypothetical protein